MLQIALSVVAAGGVPFSAISSPLGVFFFYFFDEFAVAPKPSTDYTASSSLKELSHVRDITTALSQSTPHIIRTHIMTSGHHAIV